MKDLSEEEMADLFSDKEKVQMMADAKEMEEFLKIKQYLEKGDHERALEKTADFLVKEAISYFQGNEEMILNFFVDLAIEAKRLNESAHLLLKKVKMKMREREEMNEKAETD